MSQFHINRDGTSFGPYEEAEARALFAQGNIAATDLVWRDGMASWLPASQVFGAPLTPAMATAPPLTGTPPASNADPRYATPSSWAAPAAPSAMPASTQMPMPPKLHWALVLLFSALTFGIFALVWLFVQSIWVKKIDPTSRATWFYAGEIVLSVIGNVLSSGDNPELGMVFVSLIFTMGSLVLLCCGAFSMRRSMVDYFNTVEPIGLRMSGAMTFFFNLFYFQHHMTRIATWKQTGVLTPQ